MCSHVINAIEYVYHDNFEGTITVNEWVQSETILTMGNLSEMIDELMYIYLRPKDDFQYKGVTDLTIDDLSVNLALNFIDDYFIFREKIYDTFVPETTQSEMGHGEITWGWLGFKYGNGDSYQEMKQNGNEKLLAILNYNTWKEDMIINQHNNRK